MPQAFSHAMFQDDLDFLKKHVEVVSLSDTAGKARIAIVGAYQARVMTSTTGAAAAYSLGWINRELIASGAVLPHINPYGGEERLWFGPEGGQYALFFKQGDPYDLDHWQTPALMDTEPFDLLSSDANQAHFRREGVIVNRADTEFKVRIDRTIRVLEKETAAQALGVAIPAAVDAVAYESANTVSNTDNVNWKKEGGLFSIWILGMFPPSPKATIVVPFKGGEESLLGPVVNDSYFGKIPASRLIAGDKALFFRADGAERGKIGVSPRRALPFAGSYDAERKTLTILQFTLPAGMNDYVNSTWEEQKKPFSGDAVNAYNDGPPSPGASQLGPFYEIESSSPALALHAHQSYTHTQRTIHLQGSEAELDSIAKATLGAGIEEIKGKFGR